MGVRKLYKRKKKKKKSLKKDRFKFVQGVRVSLIRTGTCPGLEAVKKERKKERRNH